jgi:taurine dioxygenase
MTISLNPLHPSIGVEIKGVDLARELPPDAVAEIRRALDEHALILLRHQTLAPGQFAGFCRGLGELKTHDMGKFQVPGNPQLVILSNILDADGEQTGFVDVGHVWHSDASFSARPHMYSCLHALEIPQHEGKALGNTWFVSTAHAYDTLPVAMQKRVEGLKCIHRFGNRYEKIRETVGRDPSAKTFASRAPLPDAIHPVVRTHPRTGRKSIYVNELFSVAIQDMPDEEAKPLLAELCRHCTRDGEIYKHQWQVGDVLVWDNCASQHIAIGDYALPQRRLLWKATIHGQVPA